MRKPFLISLLFSFLLAQVAGAAQAPTGVFNRIVTQDPSSQSAVIAGGIIAGSQRNQIVDFSGRIPALTPQYFVSLDGSQLNNVTVGALQGRTVCADSPSNLQVLTWLTADNCWKPQTGGGVGAHNLLSATHTDTAAASPVLGDLIAANNTPAWQRVAGNTTAAKQFLTQTGTGAVSALPAWAAIVAADISSGELALVRGGTNQNTWTASRCVRVNAGGTALESAADDCGSGGGAAAFLDLTDVPASYSGAANYLVRVNSTPDALEFLDPSTDFLSQYALLVGRSGGQTIIGGTGSGDDLTLQSTSNATRGDLITDVADITMKAASRARMEGQNRFRFLNSMASLSKSAAQEIGDSSFPVVVTFDGTSFDTDALFVTGDDTITVKISGKYLVVGSITWEANATGFRSLIIETDQSGSFVTAANFVTAPPSGVGTLPMQAVALVSLTAGKKIRMIGFQNSGGGLDVVASPDTSLSVTYLGE